LYRIGPDVFEIVHDITLTDEEIRRAFDYYFHGIDWGYFRTRGAYVAMAYKPITR
jgi:hypothetical protein